MKTSIVFLLYLLSPRWGNCKGIDSIKTNKELIKFLVRTIDKGFKNNDIFRSESEQVYKWNEDEYGTNKFYKADIDKNGLTDIFVDGKYCFVIFDKGDNYEICWIERSSPRRRYSFSSFLSLQEKPLMILLRDQEKGDKNHNADQLDTIIYKFGGFVEYNPHPTPNKINRVSFSSSGCYGFCPIFCLEILKDRQAIYNAILYNDSTGNFIGKINKNDFQGLSDLLSYLEINSLKNRYSVPSTDQPSAWLNIYFDDGTSKEIFDYGMVGTLGLKILYKTIQGLRNAADWTQWNKTSPPLDSFILSFKTSFTHRFEWYMNDTDFIQSIEWKLRDTDRKEVLEFNSNGYGLHMLLQPDSTFIFTYQQTFEQYSKLSLGKWSHPNDSTLLLKWDGHLTLNTCGQETLYKKYLSTPASPIPLRIENWKFIYSKDKRVLNPQ